MRIAKDEIRITFLPRFFDITPHCHLVTSKYPHLVEKSTLNVGIFGKSC
jgi:hypothetical protein